MWNTWTGGPRLGDKPPKVTHYLDTKIGQWREISTNIMKKPKCIKNASDLCNQSFCDCKRKTK